MRPLAPHFLVRLEGAAFLSLAVYLYVEYGRSWGLVAALVLIPDLSITVYWVSRQLGAAIYNAAHTYAWPALLIGLGVARTSDLMLSIGLIWLAHIGVDRMLGYGLKYPVDFKQTHIQRL